MEKTRSYTLFAGLIVWMCLLLFTGKVAAQRTMFDVPTADVTEYKKVMFQQNAVIEDQLKLASNFAYGVAKNFEIGLNVEKVNFVLRRSTPEVVSNEPEETPAFLVTAQKVAVVKEWCKFSLGTRTGTNVPSAGRGARLASFNYLVSGLSIPHTHFRLTLAGYYTNEGYAGEGTRAGMMVGMEVPIVEDKFHLQGNFISGNNSLSNFVGGVSIFLPKQWELSIGGQFPVPGSGNQHGLVFQLTSP